MQPTYFSGSLRFISLDRAEEKKKGIQSNSLGETFLPIARHYPPLHRHELSYIPDRYLGGGGIRRLLTWFSGQTTCFFGFGTGSDLAYSHSLYGVVTQQFQNPWHTVDLIVSGILWAATLKKILISFVTQRRNGTNQYDD